MHDQFGNRVSCDSRSAVRSYDRAADCHLRGWPGVPQALDEALAQAPDFALAHALQAQFLAGLGQGAAAREALTRARAAPHDPDLEESHIDLIAAVIEGRVAQALQLLIAHARKFPGDALAASTGLGAYGLFAFSGRADHDAARLEFVETLAPHYPADYPWLLAYRGWSRIEAGAVTEGMEMAKRALALRPENAHNAHIVLHGHAESGQPQDALQFIGQWLPGYSDTALMWGHLQWHAALAHIELGQIDRATAILAGPLVKYLPHGTPFMGLADMVSLTWRLALRDVAPLPWAVAREHAQRHYPRGSNVFGELHLAMLAAAHGDRGELAAVHDRIRLIADGGHEGAPVALRWVQGLRALLDGDERAAAAHLDDCCDGAVRLGGSHAQRSVIEQTRQAMRLPHADAVAAPGNAD